MYIPKITYNPLLFSTFQQGYYLHNSALTLIETFLHVCLILWVEEIEARLCQQLLWRISQDCHNPLVDKSEFAIHGMTRNEL